MGNTITPVCSCCEKSVYEQRLPLIQDTMYIIKNLPQRGDAQLHHYVKMQEETHEKEVEDLETNLEPVGNWVWELSG